MGEGGGGVSKKTKSRELRFPTAADQIVLVTKAEVEGMARGYLELTEGEEADSAGGIRLPAGLRAREDSREGVTYRGLSVWRFKEGILKGRRPPIVLTVTKRGGRIAGSVLVDAFGRVLKTHSMYNAPASERMNLLRERERLAEEKPPGLGALLSELEAMFDGRDLTISAETCDQEGSATEEGTGTITDATGAVETEVAPREAFAEAVAAAQSAVVDAARSLERRLEDARRFMPTQAEDRQALIEDVAAAVALGLVVKVDGRETRKLAVQNGSLAWSMSRGGYLGFRKHPATVEPKGPIAASQPPPP